MPVFTRFAQSAVAIVFVVTAFGCAGKQARLLVALPDYCNTPDGMSLQPDNSIIVSVPNFNDETKPPLLMKITADNRAEKFYRFPTPYPGLDEKVNRIAPMGIVRAPSGDLYLADMQYMKDKNQKSRLWRLVVQDGKVEQDGAGGLGALTWPTASPSATATSTSPNRCWRRIRSR